MKPETRWMIALAFMLGAWIGAAQAPESRDPVRWTAEAIAKVLGEKQVEDCQSDQECYDQCMRELPPNRPESECDDELGTDPHVQAYRRVRI